MFPYSSARRSHRLARVLHHSIFVLFGLLITQLEWREYNGKDEVYEVVDEILTGLSIEMIETWTTYSSSRGTSAFVTYSLRLASPS
jgi:hypothetical protein